MKVKIEALVAWSAPRRVETRRGPRNLRTAPATDDFWAAWKSAKAELKAAGVGCGRNRDGAWEACWWLPIDEDEAKKIDEALAASRATDATVDLPKPDGLEYLPYQKAGIAYALNRSSVLFGDEMGLGKTIQAIGVWNADPSLKRCLVICPASLRLNWRMEFLKWTTRPARVAIVNGGKPSDFPTAGWDVLIINYDILAKHRKRLDGFDIDLMVVDEVHYCKNPDAQRTRNVFGWKTRKGEIKLEAIKARRKLFLTGTPIVNRPIELWPLVRSLDPQGMGRSFFGFAKRYTNAHHNGYGWDFSGATHLDELQRKLREKFMVRRLKKDVLTELPAKRRQVVEIPANGAAAAVAAEKEAADAYDDMLAELRAAVELAKASDDPEAYAEAVARLKEGVSYAFTEMARARHDVARAKVPVVCEYLESALDSGPVVCFAHHRDVIASLKEHFGDRAVTLTGDTPMKERQNAVDRFQKGEVDLFLGNMKAAGVGLTLTASSHVVFAELDWVPGNVSQAEDRCHRIGQTNAVLVTHIVLEDSIDGTMAKTIIEKQEVIDKALDRKPDEDAFAVPTKEVPATVDVKPDKIAELAAKLTPEQIAAAHLGLRQLAEMCDGAQDLDGWGFNKMDTRIGKTLAAKSKLTPREAVLGIKFVTRYQRQLAPELVAAAKGE